jgi:putative Mg2+ transporter-C (MgtC) family protein
MASWWQEVAETIAGEFSDLSDVTAATRLVLRLTVAAVLGGLLGIEREHKGKAAGIRTHMLVAMGSALFVLVSQEAGIIASDMSRVIQGLIAGIGFLGAGTILKGRDEDNLQSVKGLTTAAGIWMTAAIGMAAGLGLEVTAVLSTLLALVIFSLVPLLVRLVENPSATPGIPRAESPAADKTKNTKNDS